ncbi:MAG: methylmalonyl Co-A mutase-associated GTPase MeaB [Sandaracinaceae bacterium]
MSALDVDAIAEGVRRRDRAALGRALTLMESEAPGHRGASQALLSRLLPLAGGAIRVGITGPPGVGKSTIIDALGAMLLERGHHVGVLAVDPSSGRSGGSILGDKTRMAKLARDERAFVRPSPSGGALGGVAQKTREARVVLEAARFDVVLIETVGVGQSETEVEGMVDHFVALLLPGSGDELQGIKRGVLELADVVAVNKADGELSAAAERTRHQHALAIKLLGEKRPGWTPPVLSLSARAPARVEALWSAIEAHRAFLEGEGALAEQRAEQDVRWMWRIVDDGARQRLRADPKVAALAAELERDVRDGRAEPRLAALRLLDA